MSILEFLTHAFYRCSCGGLYVSEVSVLLDVEDVPSGAVGWLVEVFGRVDDCDGGVAGGFGYAICKALATVNWGCRVSDEMCFPLYNLKH